jgi:uncharacterized protein (DUF924 family)
MQAPEDVIRFWFVDHGQPDWFGGKPEFDAEIAAKFTATHAAVAAGEAYTWRKTAEGRLAEIIVLDQFSRQLFRGQAKAFATDGMALVLAQEAIAQGLDKELDTMQRTFLYLPYQHSESPSLQAQSLRLFQSIGNEQGIQFARWHVDVIQRFGRFPKRNKALGRESTPEELAYINSGEHTF